MPNAPTDLHFPALVAAAGYFCIRMLFRDSRLEVSSAWQFLGLFDASPGEDGTRVIANLRDGRIHLASLVSWVPITHRKQIEIWIGDLKLERAEDRLFGLAERLRAWPRRENTVPATASPSPV